MSIESSHSQVSASTLLGGLLGVVFLLYNLWSFADHYRLNQNGVTLQAQVTSSKVTRRKGGISYNVTYSFDLAGQHYEGEGALSQHTFSTLRLGGPILVRYASVNPSISEPAEMSHDRASLFLHGVIGIPVSLFILFAAFRKEEKYTDPDQSIRGAGIEIPPRVRGIAYTLYPVTDMKRARKFYEDDLGLKVSSNWRGERIEYDLQGSCFAISTSTNGIRPSPDSGGTLALEVYNLEKFVSGLKQKGISIKRDPFSDFEGQMAVVLDPEGNALTLLERRS